MLNQARNFSSMSRSSNNKLRVFVAQPIPKQAIDILESNKNIQLEINEKTPLSREKFLASIKNVDAIFCTLNEKINRETLDAAGSNLKVLTFWSIFIILYE